MKNKIKEEDCQTYVKNCTNKKGDGGMKMINNKNKLHIKIEISDSTGRTIINHSNFDKAIISLINERECHNFFEKDELVTKIKKVFKK